jgi:hypothetical protein
VIVAASASHKRAPLSDRPVTTQVRHAKSHTDQATRNGCPYTVPTHDAVGDRQYRNTMFGGRSTLGFEGYTGVASMKEMDDAVPISRRHENPDSASRVRNSCSVRSRAWPNIAII